MTDASGTSGSDASDASGSDASNAYGSGEPSSAVAEEAPYTARLADLVRRLRAAGWDPAAEQVAEALWLARWIEPEARDAERSPADRLATAEELPAPASSAPRERVGDGDRVVPEEDAERAGDRARGRAPFGDRLRTAPVSLYAPDRHAGAPGSAFPVRAPAVGTLPGLLGLQRALRPLIGYDPRLPIDDGPLDESASAELSARSAVVRPAFGPAERRGTELQLLMDASATTSVWQLTLDSLRQTCEQLGAFRDVQVRYLHGGADGTPLIGTGPQRSTTRLRSPDQYRDTTGRRLTLVVSDCVGPLWQNGGAQRLLHRWVSGGSPVAVVQPLPPRLWPRTALPAEPGTLLREQGRGGRIGFEPEGGGAYGPAHNREFGPPYGVAYGTYGAHGSSAPDALPVPVLLPTPAALGSWARLLGGDGGHTVRGAAAWVRARHHAMPAPSTAGGSRDPRELLDAFRASASSGALRLAVHLAAVPLVLPVIQLVQEAMLPDTGPMELAEVLLSGLLERLPGIEGQPGPRYTFAPGVRELLLQSLDQGAATLVLKHLAEYFGRRFGRSTRNFPALAVARLSGRTGEPEPAVSPPEPGHRQQAPADDLFAEVPAGVVRWYLPESVEQDRLAAAERLLGRWWAEGDPRRLHEARTLAEAAVTAAGGVLDSAADDPEPESGPAAEPEPEPEPESQPSSPASGSPERRGGTAAEEEIGGLPRARQVLGKVLHALAETGRARREPAYAHEVLHGAERQLTGRALDTRFELAAVQHDLWQAEGDTGYLRAAADTLRTMVHEATEAGRPLPARAEGKRRLWLGRILLALAGTGAAERSGAVKAVRELRGAVELLAGEGGDEGQVQGQGHGQGQGGDGSGDGAEGGDGRQLCTARLDLSSALRRAGADTAERLDNLDRAQAAAGDNDLLRLRCARARARVLRDAGDWEAADAAYASAEGFAGRDSLERGELLTEWGAMLLESGAEVTRAESVLREALTGAPSTGRLAARLQLLLGRALAERYHREHFLPDLYEGCHLLEQAARQAPDAELRAEGWLLIARARQDFPAGHVPPGRAEDALDRSLAEAREARGAATATATATTVATATATGAATTTGSVAVARALHARGVLRQTQGRTDAALTDYRDAGAEWLRLTTGLPGEAPGGVPWEEVRETRRRIAVLEAAGGGSPRSGPG